MTPPPNLDGLRQCVLEALRQQPDRMVIRLEVDGQSYWLKRRPLSKKMGWHRVQALLAFLVRIPQFRPTVSQGDPESLRREAERLNRFREQGIPVPEVVFCDGHVLVTEDRGVQLDAWLKQQETQAKKQAGLERAMRLLIQLHDAGLVHGRPMPRDMVIRDEVLTLIDLEEAPEQVMSLAEAQARDVWLFMVAVAGLLEEEAAAAVFQLYRTRRSPETERALRRLLAWARPFSRVLRKTVVRHLGRDLRKAVLANEIMADVLEPRAP